MKVSKAIAVEIVRRHGWEPRQQTAVLNGEVVESGSSFFENLGEREEYALVDVRNWLGY